MRVERRRVIYVQGYDPRGLAQYYRMFRTELRKFGRLYQLTATINRPQGAADGETAYWIIDTHASDWQTHTRYDFLRWEDLIQRDLAAPIWRTVFRSEQIFWRIIFNGVLARIWKAHWRFALFIAYPHFMLLVEALASLLVAFACGKGLEALGVTGWANIAAAAAVFMATLIALLKFTESRSYLLYLMADMIWTWQFAHRLQPEWDQRIDRFAKNLVEIASSNDAEEIVIVGHSSGSFLAVEILTRALKFDPDIGRYGPRIALLTIGGNLPIVGFNAAAQDFRDHLRRLAVEPSIDWIDCQARKDVMNFYPFDVITGHGIDVGASRRNPRIVSVRFRDIIEPAHYNRFRWQFFRVHFQFVMANERPHPYDFFMIACGPVPLRERMARPEAAVAIATGDLAARESGWKTLETSIPNPAGGPDLGKMEPSTSHRG
ncbi:MAG: hypothetical protein KGK01_14110 [Bradyrhizobium sp.]|uniref:hypothetical protein n=1 Tax=Bradyrhizobium sp. TaxID=376 RepID=UPI001C28C028|nr:hypothetical protein [Bradyrhizobium sp.]MBU6464729.1 hypothetical protein [Pseudomonadota bacterium]MDE2068683.1 hypothetical protein [Bradyrhizobium sp.]MDE2243513.1 hypothetical protein [Bradyrhizobium sp.]MDE2468573.1 hypothetical protein [Bradyrhizobium sp.]